MSEKKFYDYLKNNFAENFDLELIVEEKVDENKDSFSLKPKKGTELHIDTIQGGLVVIEDYLKDVSSEVYESKTAVNPTNISTKYVGLDSNKSISIDYSVLMPNREKIKINCVVQNLENTNTGYIKSFYKRL